MVKLPDGLTDGRSPFDDSDGIIDDGMTDGSGPAHSAQWRQRWLENVDRLNDGDGLLDGDLEELRIPDDDLNDSAVRFLYWGFGTAWNIVKGREHGAPPIMYGTLDKREESYQPHKTLDEQTGISPYHQ